MASSRECGGAFLTLGAIKMNYYLTNPNPEFSRLVAQTRRGMFFWSGTCTDPDATCAGCRHFGYEGVARKRNGTSGTRKYPKSCALVHQYTGKHGTPFDPQTPACKYFEKTNETISAPSGAGAEDARNSADGEQDNG